MLAADREILIEVVRVQRERRGAHDRELSEARFLGDFSPSGLFEALFTYLDVPAELEPRANLAVVVKRNELAGGIDHDPARGEVHGTARFEVSSFARGCERKESLPLPRRRARLELGEKASGKAH